MTPDAPSLGCALFNSLPYRFLTGLPDGEAALELEITDEVLGPNASVHAGVTMVLADVAGAMAIATRHALGGATQSVSVHCLAPARVGPIRASATVLKLSRNSALADVHVVDVGADERLVAVAHVTAALFHPRPEQA